MYISIDIGGTNTRIASSRNLRGFVTVHKFNTFQNIEEQKKKLLETVDFVLLDEKIDGLIIGVPGLFDSEKKLFTKIPNVPDMMGKSFSDLIGEGDNFFVENDAALAGLGEASYGAGRTRNIFAYITLGTGVGGCIIKNDGLNLSYERKEPGHDVTLSNGKSMEVTLGGKYFFDNYGVNAEECEDSEIWGKYASFLLEGIKNIYKDWDVDYFVLGGNISKKFEFYGSTLNNSLGTITVERCQLLDNSGIYGGLVYLRSIKGFESVA